MKLNESGHINKIISNDFASLKVKTGNHVIELFEDIYHQEFYNQFSHILQDTATTGFRAALINKQSVYVLLLRNKDQIDFITLNLSNDTLEMFEEVLKTNNDQIRTIRELYKKLAKHENEAAFLEEIMLVNNELINTRRELANKNKQLRVLNQQLESINFTDFLTKTNNRRKFFIDIYEFAESSSHFLIMMDFNNFKIINDELGHKIGDEALISLVNSLIREFTVFNGSIYRLGGDEFACLVDSNQTLDFNLIFENITNDVKKIHPKTGIAYGIVEINKRNVNTEFKAEIQMNKADIQMYRMKQQFYRVHKK